MNLETELKETIEACKNAVANQAEVLSKVQLGRLILKPVITSLSETVTCNAYGGIFWLDVYNREDLQILMTLAPQWSKTTEGDIIKYEATVEDVNFQLRAHDAALPGSCKLVEEEYVVPAQPARTEKRMVVRCNTTTVEPTELVEAQS